MRDLQNLIYIDNELNNNNQMVIHGDEYHKNVDTICEITNKHFQNIDIERFHITHELYYKMAQA